MSDRIQQTWAAWGEAIREFDADQRTYGGAQRVFGVCFHANGEMLFEDVPVVYGSGRKLQVVRFGGLVSADPALDELFLLDRCIERDQFGVYLYSRRRQPGLLRIYPGANESWGSKDLLPERGGLGIPLLNL